MVGHTVVKSMKWPLIINVERQYNLRSLHFLASILKIQKHSIEYIYFIEYIYSYIFIQLCSLYNLEQ